MKRESRRFFCQRTEIKTGFSPTRTCAAIYFGSAPMGGRLCEHVILEVERFDQHRILLIPLKSVLSRDTWWFRTLNLSLAC